MNSNFKRTLLGLSLLATAAVSFTAAASAIEDRVTQLERISTAQGQALTQLQQQLFSTQRDIDDLRGQIETSQYQLNKVVESQRQIYSQIDAVSNGNPVRETATNTPPVASTSATTASGASTSSEEQDYQNAVSLILEKKQYNEAITALQAFLKNYPKSTRYAANANYWLGQAFYNQGEKDNASYYFAVVVKEYSTSAKAADSMYKVGIILQEKGQFDKAKAIYQQISKLFPASRTAKQAEKRLIEM